MKPMRRSLATLVGVATTIFAAALPAQAQAPAAAPAPAEIGRAHV